MRTEKNRNIMPPAARGFSLLEVTVAIAIFSLLTTVVLFRFNAASNNLQFQSFAEQLGLWVREAQVSAISVKHTVATQVQNYPGYGLHFDITTPDRFTYFADIDGNKRYNAAGTCGAAGAECERVIMLPTGVTIQKLCGETPTSTASPAECTAQSLPDTANNFDIVFTRPDPDAEITGEYPVGSSLIFSRADIVLVSAAQKTRIVEVWTTGQISVR